MKIAVFGASGRIGSRIVQEALVRGHAVTAVVRDPAHQHLSHPQLAVTVADILNSADVAQAATDHDVVVSAIGPTRKTQPQIVVDAAWALIEGLKRAGVRRLIISGGAGSLEVAPGLRLVDSPTFPETGRAIALAHCEALEIYRHADLDWTYLSPPARLKPGERTGTYRKGTDSLLTNAHGESRISMEDYAIALVDEMEHPQFVRQRFTVAS
jgi:putative NADH-flavin reductase